MFLKLRSHLIIAGLFFVATLSQQYLFYTLKGLPVVYLSIGKYLATFLFFFAATFIKFHFLRYFFLSFVMGLNFFQMCHLSYYGTQALPSEFYIFFTQFHEVGGTLEAEWHHVLIPFLFTLIPMGLCFALVRKKTNLYGTHILSALFCLYLIYNPIRTFVTGNTWGRQPSTRELSGMNLYLTLSYFTGKILPYKLNKASVAASPNSSLQLTIEGFKKPEWDKVVFILGESLTPHHMNLFGYARPTTPFLSTLKDNKNFSHTIALSSGVSTDIAVAFLLNMGYGDSGSIKAAKGDHCLFKLAKRADFSTHFLSIQSSEQLRYISPYLCSSSLDEYKAMEDIAPGTKDHQAASDRDLLPALKNLINTEDKQFIMLHQRGSHAPWGLRFSPEAKIFKEESSVDHYDNSVVEFDLFWKELHGILSKSSKKILVIYLSDHGEGLGEQGHWGHGFLNSQSFEIPFLVYAHKSQLPESARKLPRFAPQYNLSLFLAEQLGFKLNQSSENPVNDFVVYGNDIDGFAGKAEVKFNKGAYTFQVIP